MQEYAQIWTAILSASAFCGSIALAGGYYIAKAREKAVVTGADRQARSAFDLAADATQKIAQLEGKVTAAMCKADAIEESLHTLNSKLAAREKAQAARDRRAVQSLPSVAPMAEDGQAQAAWPSSFDDRLNAALAAQGTPQPQKKQEPSNGRLLRKSLRRL